MTMREGHPPARRERAARTAKVYSELLEDLGGIVFVCDPATLRVWFVSPRAEELLGHSLEDWTEDPELWSRLTTGIERDRLLAALRQTAIDACPRKLVHRVRTRDGRYVWMRTAIRARSAPRGPVEAVVGLMVDIAERIRAEEVLRSREERARMVLEQVPVIVWTTDRDLRLTSTGGAGLLRIGGRPDELVGVSMYELVGGADHPYIAPSLRAVSGESVDFWADRHGRSFAVHVEPFRDASGAIIGSLGSAIDMTSLKRARDQLQASEERLRAVVEASPDPIFLKDAAGRWQVVNRAGVELFRLERLEFLGKTDAELAEVAPSPYREAFLTCVASDEETWQKGHLTRNEEYVPRRDGTLGVYDVYKLPLFNPDGTRRAFVVLGRDITERYQAEKEVERRAAELRTLLDQSPDGVIGCDADGRLTLMNERALRFFGLESLDDVGGGHGALLARIDVRRRDGTPMGYEDLAITRALRTGRPVGPIEQRVRTPRGDMNISASAAPIHAPDGTILGAVTTFRDETARVEFEEQREQFVRVAAHELKTPVTIMKGHAQTLLQRTDLPDASRTMLEAINRGADRIDRIARNLLDVIQLGRRRLVLYRESFDLAELVEESARQLRATSPKHAIRVVHADPACVHADRARIKEVIDHLIDNAIRYSPAGGPVDIELRTAAGEAVISVRDRGIGIPEAKQARMFEPFYRAHEGTPYDYGGMGVELHLASEIVARHGGRMWFESREAEGSRFFVGLPLQKEESCREAPQRDADR